MPAPRVGGVSCTGPLSEANKNQLDAETDGTLQKPLDSMYICVYIMTCGIAYRPSEAPMTTVSREIAKPVELEEQVEFSNVTNVRESLLSKVESLRENPAKRYVITKHGQPQAVLMSFQTYSLMRRVMDQTLARTAAMSSSDPIGAAFARFRHDQSSTLVGASEARTRAAVSAALQSIRSQVDQLYAALGQDVVGRD
jgi:PHD/YefM family antitoxin component YafN of YafNO toxin-antitoxin module